MLNHFAFSREKCRRIGFQPVQQRQVENLSYKSSVIVAQAPPRHPYPFFWLSSPRARGRVADGRASGNTEARGDRQRIAIHGDGSRAAADRTVVQGAGHGRVVPASSRVRRQAARCARRRRSGCRSRPPVGKSRWIPIFNVAWKWPAIAWPKPRRRSTRPRRRSRRCGRISIASRPCGNAGRWPSRRSKTCWPAAIRRAELDGVGREISAATIALQQAEDDLEALLARLPIAKATVSRKYVESGERVQAGQPVLPGHGPVARCASPSACPTRRSTNFSSGQTGDRHGRCFPRRAVSSAG